MTSRLQTVVRATLVTLAVFVALPPVYSGEPAPREDEIAPAEAVEEFDTDANTVPVLDATTAATPRYKPLTWEKHFDHAKALKGNCKRCHHDLRGSNTTAGKCADCHSTPVDDMTLTEAWHGLCRNCHLSDQLNGQNHGPTKCLGCHEERD
jgi:hypothetical protein